MAISAWVARKCCSRRVHLVLTSEEQRIAREGITAAEDADGNAELLLEDDAALNAALAKGDRKMVAREVPPPAGGPVVVGEIELGPVGVPRLAPVVGPAARGRRVEEEFVARLAVKARAQFGLLRYTEANKLMVDKWLRAQCKEMHVRDSDIARAVPVAVVMVFIPTKADIAARKLESAAATADRLAEGTATYDGVGPVRRVIGFITGRKPRHGLRILPK